MLPGNLGGGELLVLLLIALLVLGPDKLPSAARNVGRALTEFRRVSAGFQAELRDALQEPVAGVPKAASSTEATHALPTPEPESTTPAAEAPAPTEAPKPARRRRERPLQAERRAPLERLLALLMVLGQRRSGAGGDSTNGAARGGDADRMTLIEHLTELRNRLMKAILAVGLGAIAGFFLYDWLLEFLTQPYCDVLPPGRECQLLAVDPLSPFALRMKLAMYVGLVLASPVLLWQLWRFITPGLYPHEKRYAIPFVASSIVLFLLGAGLAYYTFPNALEFLVDIGGSQIETFYDPNKYLSLITFMMLAFGVGFEFPILLVFLQMAGVLTPDRLRKWRRGAIIFIFALVAIITPSGDPFTLFALAVPMYVFYEGSILIGWLLTRNR